MPSAYDLAKRAFVALLLLLARSHHLPPSPLGVCDIFLLLTLVLSRNTLRTPQQCDESSCRGETIAKVTLTTP